MSDDQSGVVTLKVRVTPEFREKIVNTAKQNNRSMNQEIVTRLEQSFDEVEHSFKIVSKETTLKVSQDVLDEVLKVMRIKNTVSLSSNECQEKNNE